MKEEIFHLGIKGLIRNSSGDILLLQVNPEHMKQHGHQIDTQQEYWDLPGGRVEKGATIQETLQREIAEETGITSISNISHVGMVISNIRIPAKDGNSFGLILAVYSCNVPKNAKIQLSEEHIATEWVSPVVAAKRLSIKYPSDFCQTIARL